MSFKKGISDEGLRRLESNLAKKDVYKKVVKKIKGYDDYSWKPGVVQDIDTIPDLVSEAYVEILGIVDASLEDVIDLYESKDAGKQFLQQLQRLLEDMPAQFAREVAD